MSTSADIEMSSSSAKFPVEQELPTAGHVALIGSIGADLYTEQVVSAWQTKLPISVANKAKAIVALWSTKNYAKVDQLFSLPGFLTPTDVFKVAQILDAPRKAKQLQKKLNLWSSKGLKVRNQKISKVKSDLTQLLADPHNGKLTHSFSKRVKKWCKALPADVLDHFLLKFPTDHWQALFDLTHQKASDFSADYFVPMVYGADPPKGTALEGMLNLTAANLAERLETVPALSNNYSYIRQKVSSGELKLTSNHKRLIAKQSPLEDIIWFYEELKDPLADEEIMKRLQAGETIESVRDRSNYAKLMERVLTFRELKCSFVDLLMPVVEAKLNELRFSASEGSVNVAVLGDCSASMEVAIKVATIIGSLLTVIFSAELTFFSQKNHVSPREPETAEDVIFVTKNMPARGSTSPAASLWPYYENKKVMDYVIVVTDEEENTSFNNYMFAPLLKKYREDVAPKCKVIFVSFLDVGSPGQMKPALEKELNEPVLQFRFDKKRPDLTKFEGLLSLLRTEFSSPTTATTMTTPTPTTTGDDQTQPEASTPITPTTTTTATEQAHTPAEILPTAAQPAQTDQPTESPTSPTAAVTTRVGALDLDAEGDWQVL